MKTVMSVKVDENVKQAAREVAESAGFALSTLVNAYLRQLAFTRRVDFYAPEPMTPKLERLIGKVEREIRQGKVSQPFTDVEEFLADLDR